MEQAELINTFLSAQFIFPSFFWHWYVLPSGRAPSPLLVLACHCLIDSLLHTSGRVDTGPSLVGCSPLFFGHGD